MKAADKGRKAMTETAKVPDKKRQIEDLLKKGASLPPAIDLIKQFPLKNPIRFVHGRTKWESEMEGLDQERS